MTRDIEVLPAAYPIALEVLKMEVPMKSAPRMDVVKREVKEEKLKAFITAHLSNTTAHPQPATWLLIARSSHSPVVKALNALAPEIAKAQVTVRTILALLDNGAGDTQATTMMCSAEYRVARNPRLLEAHEQLVLSPTTAWVGDSMRREPDKRDAYECYAVDHATTAHWSTVAFNRLWEVSDAIVPRGLVLAAENAADAASVDDLSAAKQASVGNDVPMAGELPHAEATPVVTASTRH
jgi:hypothetical protein